MVPRENGDAELEMPAELEMSRVEIDSNLMQAMEHIHDFLSTEETMDRLTRALSFRDHGDLKAALASDAEPVGCHSTMPRDEKVPTLRRNVSKEVPNSREAFPFIGAVFRGGENDAGRGPCGDNSGKAGHFCHYGSLRRPAPAVNTAPLPRACSDEDEPTSTGIHERESTTGADPTPQPPAVSEDWDAEVEEISEREPNTLLKPHLLTPFHALPPRPSSQLRLSAGVHATNAGYIAQGGDLQTGTSRASSARVTPQSSAPGPNTSLWRMRGQQMGGIGPGAVPVRFHQDPARSHFSGQMEFPDPRMHFSLDGRAPCLNQSAMDFSNPYVKALRAHREALLQSTVDLQDLVVDSLAARLATQRHDALTTLETNEVAPSSSTSHGYPSCGNYEHCGDERGLVHVDRLEEVLNGAEEQLSDRYVDSRTPRSHTPGQSPFTPPLTARSGADEWDLVEGKPGRGLMVRGGSSGVPLPCTAPTAPCLKPTPRTQDADVANYLQTIGAC